MKKYRCLLFDLFNTVALWYPERMPTVQLDGKQRPSTLGVLGELLAARQPHIGFEAFSQAMRATNDELARHRDDGRERPSIERFRRALLRLGLAPAEATDLLAAELSQTHMKLLSAATSVPASHLATLAELSNQFELAIVSNFDHAPTAHGILTRDGAAKHFKHIVISDAHGYRKPHRRIFDDTIALMECDAEDALFIGDSGEDDIIGARGAGLDAVWVNARGAELPEGAPRPKAAVTAITRLPQLLAQN